MEPFETNEWNLENFEEFKKIPMYFTTTRNFYINKDGSVSKKKNGEEFRTTRYVSRSLQHFVNDNIKMKPFALYFFKHGEDSLKKLGNHLVVKNNFIEKLERPISESVYLNVYIKFEQDDIITEEDS